VTQVSIPEKYEGIEVTQVLGNAFEGCDHLKKIVMHEGMKTINTDAFSGCTGLSKVVLANSITRFEDYAFHNCNLSGLNGLPNSLTYIGNYCFHSSTLPSTVTIPATVTYIGQCIFKSCKSRNTTAFVFEDPEGWVFGPINTSTVNPLMGSPYNTQFQSSYINWAGEGEYISLFNRPRINGFAIQDDGYSISDSGIIIPFADNPLGMNNLRLFSSETIQLRGRYATNYSGYIEIKLIEWKKEE